MPEPSLRSSGEKLAARLAPLSDDIQRIHRAYELLFSRPPTDRETADALTLLREFGTTEKPDRARALLCQSLYAANEFIYLR